MKRRAETLLKAASVLLAAVGTALGVWLQIGAVFSIEEGEPIPRYSGATAGIVAGLLVTRYARVRNGKWWTIPLRAVLFVLLGYPLLGIVLYALAYPFVNAEYASLVAAHLAFFGPIWWLPLLVGLALVERKRASPAGNEPTGGGKHTNGPTG